MGVDGSAGWSLSISLAEQMRKRSKRFLSLKDRLALYASEMGKKAGELPPGSERDALLRKASQADAAAARLDDWVNPIPRPKQIPRT
jgi:hypothetical protein